MSTRQREIDARVRGAALVERAIAALAIRAPKAVAPEVLSTLTLGDAPLPPSLRAWLAHHSALPRPVRTVLVPDGLGLSSWRDVSMRAFARSVLPPDPPPPLAHVGLLPLDCGSESFRAIAVSHPDAHGELPVLDVDVDGPSVTLALPGFDVWLAVVAGLVDPRAVETVYAGALREHAQHLGGTGWERRTTWAPVAGARWEPPPYPRPRASADDATELVETVRDGDVAGVRDLLDAGVSASAPDPIGRTPLASAAANGAPEIVSLLLERGAPPDALDHTGQTPLAFIAGVDWWWYAKAGPHLLDGWLRCLRILVAAGADPNVRDAGQRTPIVSAAWRRSLPLVRTLLDLGADPRVTPSPLPALVSKPAGRRTQPARDVVACLELLLARGADPHVRTAEGRSLLDLAAEDPKMPKAVRAILERHGAG